MDRGDYRVTYRTREVDHDDERFERTRRQLPTALDPYRYPDDREELKRAVAETRVRSARYDEDYPRELPVRQRLRDETGESTTRSSGRPGTTKTTYSVTPAGLEKESVVSDKPAGSVAASRRENREDDRYEPPPSAQPRREYREDDRYESARVSSRSLDRPENDRGYSSRDRAYELERPRIERPRYEGGAYVIDTDADHVSVYAGQGLRESDRGYGGFRNDPYNYDSPRASYSRGPAQRSSEAVYSPREAGRDDAYMSGARPPREQVKASRTVAEDDYSTRGAPRGPSRNTFRAEEDDYAFIERQSTRDRAPSIKSFRDPNYASTETPRARGRSTVNQSPPDDYVMVSPPRDDATVATGKDTARTGTSLRSALVRGNSYTAEERLQRRRSRSINFRDKDVEGHYVGETWHEEPGREAAMMGRHLRSFDGDGRSDRYGSKAGGRRSDEEIYNYERQDREQYAPQRVRSRSRGARRREEDDDRSYVDKKLTKTKTTTYY